MTLDDLRAEHARETIGALIYGEVATLVRQVASGYSPQVYARVSNWDAGFEDLLQEVILERLLGEGQLAYAFTVDADLAHWRALIVRQIKRTLAKRRTRSVVDNILDRADEILSRPPFASAGTGRTVQHWKDGSSPEDRLPTEEEIRAATLAASGVPITRGHGDERAPMVYSTAALEMFLLEVASALPCKFSKTDLDRILRNLLTQWLASDLVDIESALQLPTESLAPEELAEVNDIATRVLESTDLQGRIILRAKLNDVSDGDIAVRLGVSRPTVASRKAALLERLRAELEGQSKESADAVVMRIAALLAEPRWNES